MSDKEACGFDLQKFMVTSGSIKEFEDDTPKQINVEGVSAQEIAQLLEDQALNARLRKEEEDKQKATEQQKEASKPVVTDTGLQNHNCPHCNWDQRKKVTYEPNDEDRQAFIESLVTGLPFAKKFTMVNGKVTIIFRAIRDEEIHFLLADYARACSHDRTTATSAHQRVYQDAQPLLQIQELSVTGGVKYVAPAGFIETISPGLDDYILTVEKYEEQLKLKKPVLDLLLADVRKKCPPTARPLVAKAAAMFYSAYESLTAEFSKMVDDEQKEQNANF